MDVRDSCTNESIWLYVANSCRAGQQSWYGEHNAPLQFHLAHVGNHRAAAGLEIGVKSELNVGSTLAAADQQGSVSDQALVHRVIKREQLALESLYRRHRAVLYSVALRILGDTCSAEEILQDAFFQLWKNASQFDPAKGSLLGWLLVITRNRAISRARLNKSRYFSTLTGNEDGTLPENAESNVLQRLIACELVACSLAKLSDAQRQTVTLAYFDGLSCPEIAHHTHTPIGTVKARLKTGFQGMRKGLPKPEWTQSPS